MRALNACSYRQVGNSEFQPDASYYFEKSINAIHTGIHAVDLDIYNKPDLVVEVSDTTISDDKGTKRLLYKTLRIPEYWILDVQAIQISAFGIAPNGSSQRIEKSLVLPDFSFALAEEALRLGKASNQTEANAWFMKQLA